MMVSCPCMVLLNLLTCFELSTVENVRHFFPHCSEVLDMFMEDENDMPDVFFLEEGTEEQKGKKARFTELKDEVQTAFHSDMAAEADHSGFSSSVSSSSSSTR